MENIFFEKNELKYCGEGVIIGKTVRIRKPKEVSIGDGTIIDDFCYISCSADIGNHCHIASHVNISGGGGHLTMGNYVGIASGCTLNIQSSNYLTASFDHPSIPKEDRFGGYGKSINLGDHVLLGAQTIVLPDVTLPEGVATAAQTILRNKSYDPWRLYIGPNAKRLLRRNNNKLFQHLANLKKY